MSSSTVATTPTPTTLTLAAHAKLNLVLAIGPLREDGYHGVMSAMQALELADMVTVKLGDEVSSGLPGAAGAGAAAAASVRTPGAAAAERANGAPNIVVDAPTLVGGDTLATRAARDYMQVLVAQTNVPARDVHVTLDKVIPVGAGLGGGSSNAAAVLVALDQLLGSPLSVEQVSAIAAGIGSDVPFFLSPTRSAICSGRGEIVMPLPPLPERRVLLAWPRVEQSTAAIYAAHMVRRDVLPLSAAVAANARHGTCYNDLTGTALALCKPMRAVSAAIERAGIMPLVAGSGATVAALLSDDADVRELQRELEALGCWTIVTSTC